MTSYGLWPRPDFHPSAPPLIDHSDLEKPLTLTLDEPASIRVRISGIPRPSVRWQVGRRRIKESARFHLKSDGGQGQGHTLQISKVTRDLEQGVWVVASNVYGEDCSCVEVRTLEAAIKRRPFKIENNSKKRPNSLTSETSGTRENSSTNLVSVKNNSISSLKDWESEMVVRNAMRSVDDLVFSSSRASQMTGLGYSLSVNTAVDDSDSTERQRSRHRPPPLTTTTSTSTNATGLVFHEVEPRRFRPNRRLRSPAEKEESAEELEVACSPETNRSNPLSESAVATVNHKASEISNDVQVRGNVVGVAKKFRQRKKRDESTENSTPTIIATPGDRSENTSTTGDGLKSDKGRGDERNLHVASYNLSSEQVDGVWVLLDENLSDVSPDAFERFPRVETNKEADVCGLNPRRKTNGQPLEADISKSLGILLSVDRGKTAASKFGVLRDTPATGKHNNNKRITGTHSTQKEIHNSGKTTDNRRFSAEPSKQLTSETGNVLQNGSAKIKKRLNHQNSLSLADNINKVEAKFDSVYPTESALLDGKNDVKHRIKSKNRVGQKTKSLVTLDTNVAKHPGKSASGKSEGNVEVSRNFPIDSKESEQEHAMENHVRKKQRRVSTKDRTRNSDSIQSKVDHHETVKLETTTTDPRIISDVENREHVTGPAVQMSIISKHLTDGSESVSQTKRKKISENAKAIKQAPLIISNTVGAGEEFAVVMENDEKERKSTGKVMKKPAKRTPKSKEIPAAVTTSNSASFTESRQSENFSGNPSTNPVKPRRRKVENKSQSAKSKSDDENPSVGETREMNYLENGNLFAITDNCYTPAGDILDYCNGPVRNRSITTSSRDPKDGSRKVTCYDDLEKSSENAQSTGDRRRISTRNNGPTAETGADRALVTVKDNTENNNKKATKTGRKNKTHPKSSSFHFNSRLELLTSETTTMVDSTVGQPDIPANIRSGLEILPLPTKSDPVFQAHETLFLKSLVQKLHSGQIEIIVVDKNRNAKSNKDELNTTPSATTSNLGAILNLFGASGKEKTSQNLEEREEIAGDVGEKFEDPQIENESEDKEKYNIITDSVLPTPFSEQTACFEGDGFRREKPVPKPRTLSMKTAEFKRGAFVDKGKGIRTVSNGNLQSENADVTKFSSNVTETQLAEGVLHPSELNTAINVSEFNDKSHGSESFELISDEGLSTEDSTRKENSKKPPSKKSQEPQSGKSKSSKNQHPSASLPNDVIAEETSLPEVRKTQKRTTHNSSLDYEVCNLNGQIDSEQGVVSNSIHVELRTPRQKPIKAYNPVYPNYWHANGNVQRQSARSDTVRDVGRPIIRRPGDYFSELLPNFEDKNLNKTARNFPASADHCSTNTSKKYSTKSKEILEENATVAQYSKNSRSLNVQPTNSKGKLDFNSKLFDNFTSDSIIDCTSVKAVEPVEQRELNLESKSAKNLLINNNNSQALLFIDESADDLESRDFDKQRRYRSRNGLRKGVVRGRRK